jgi:hypothetical protein
MTMPHLRISPPVEAHVISPHHPFLCPERTAHRDTKMVAERCANTMLFDWEF